MAKKTIVCLILIMVLSVVLAGCVGNGNSNKKEEKKTYSYAYDFNGNDPTINICFNNIPPEYGNITDRNIIPTAQTHSRTTYSIAVTFEGGQIIYVDTGESLWGAKIAKIKTKLKCETAPD